uniref:Ribosomal protein uS12 methylthiotransferase RimO n=1 Tax=uncultured Spirochaetaceae bacterium TaxID=201186 RepID=A0A650EP78_9SPIO|nr:ribosomal protein S12 methylthiotransferase RimO [uncultured Spirochaetaceae bacterium]
MTEKTKKFFLDEHGCAKNQVDGEIIISNLIRAGYERAELVEDADFIVINSCGFIESAKKESLDALVAARKMFPKKKIIFAGCLAQRYSEIFKTELPEADGIFGNGDLNQIADFVKKILRGKRTVLAPEQAGVNCAERLVNLSYENSAYVKITEGCSNHCAFCAIPLIRGELRSRPSQDVLAEIKSLLRRGVFEINLVGQDLASYGTEESFARGKEKSHSPLYDLLEKISALKGKFWVRLLYIHPDHFPLDILELIKKDSRLLAYFDIPFQSGDDDVIRAMNRKCTRKMYIELVHKIREAIPEAAIRTTFLSGFPGESESAFLNTLDFLEEIRADWAGAFCFSKEDGTPAAKMKNPVPKKLAATRQKILLEAQEKITAENLARRIKNKNCEYEVLIEEVFSAEEGEAFAIGRAWFEAPDVDGNFVVRFDGEDEKTRDLVKPGNVVRAKAVGVSGVDIDSVLVENSDCEK